MGGNVFAAFSRLHCGAAGRGSGSTGISSGSTGIPSDCLLVVTSLGTLHCLVTRTGAHLWELDIGLGPISSPTAVSHLHPHNVWAGGDTLLAVASSRGCVTFLRLPTEGSQVMPTLAEAGQGAIMPMFAAAGQIVNASSSPAPEVLLSVQMPGEIFSPPVFSPGEGSLFFGCRDDRMHKLRLSPGAPAAGNKQG